MVLQSNDRNKMLGAVTTGLEETVTGTVRSMMTETVDPLAEAMDKHIQSAKAIETITEDTVRIQKMTEEMCDKYQALLERLTSAQTSVTNNLTEAGVAIRDAGEKLSDSYDKFVSATATQLNGSLKTFSDSMMAMSAMINQKMAASEVERINTAEQLGEIRQLLARLVQQTERTSMTTAGKQEGGKEAAEA